MLPVPLKLAKAALWSASALINCLLLIGCGQSTWSDKEGAIVEGIRIDTVRLVPAHSRFVLRDSTTKILFKGYHVGYRSQAGQACTEILEMRLQALSQSQTDGYGPITRIRLPSGLDCPLDTTGHDSILTYVFPKSDNSTLRLRNSIGIVTDSAKLISGRFFRDSLKGIPSSETKTIGKGRWTFLDSTSLTPRRLYADSLGCGEFLNQGTYAIKSDTVKVQVSWVSVDTAFLADTCQGQSHQEEIKLDRIAF